MLEKGLSPHAPEGCAETERPFFHRSARSPRRAGRAKSMKRAISEIVGRVEAAGDATVAIYRALRSLRCASCDTLIAEGELFTRRNTFGQSLRILPRCRRCAPFASPTEPATTGHPMLDSLLSTAAEQPPVSKGRPVKKPLSGDESDDEKQKRIAEAMIERLGPALRRTRRHRT
jgi:phage FluMu protein Com